LEHPWPGNVRELEDLMRRLMLTVRGPVVGRDDLQLGQTAAVADTMEELLQLDYHAAISRLEKMLLQHAPSHDHIQRQGSAQGLGTFDLPSFHPADIFEHLMPTFDAPSQPIPSYQAPSGLERIDFPITQEHPLDRLNSFGRVDFSGHQRPQLLVPPTVLAAHPRGLNLDFSPPQLQCGDASGPFLWRGISTSHGSATGQVG